MHRRNGRVVMSSDEKLLLNTAPLVWYRSDNSFRRWPRAFCRMQKVVKG